MPVSTKPDFATKSLCTRINQQARGMLRPVWEPTSSMSRKGNCCDNAPMESFFWHVENWELSTLLFCDA